MELETIIEVEDVKVEVFPNIWVRRDIFRNEVREGEEEPAEPAACAGGGGEETRDHRLQKSSEDGDAGEVDRGTRLWLIEKMGMGPMSPNGSSDTEPFLSDGDAGEEAGREDEEIEQMSPNKSSDSESLRLHLSSSGEKLGEVQSIL